MWWAFAASSTPRSSVAAVISSDSSRACPPPIRFSARSSIHFTGRSPMIMAATTVACSSLVGNAFCPNDPPTSPMITRMSSSARPSIRE